MSDGCHDQYPRPSASLASPGRALRRLPASEPRFWLVRSPAIEAGPAARGEERRSRDRNQDYGLVLLHGLPGVLVTLGQEGLGHD